MEAFPLAIQPSEPFRQSLARLAGYSNDVDVAVDAAGILFGDANIEWHVGQQIDLVQDQQLRLEKDRGVFERLVFSLRDAENHKFCRFAQIVARRTDEVADVFDQQQIDVLQTPIEKGPFDHAGIEMACAAGGNLLHRKPKPGQPFRVVFRLDVPGENGHSFAVDRSFQGCVRAGWFFRTRVS